MAIEIIEQGFIITIQDRGRFGFRRFGVPVSGAMDWFAFTAANRLVDNEPNSAAFEIGILGASFQINQEYLVALCGPGVSLFINNHRHPGWTSVLAPAGSTIRIERNGVGCWAYLAVHGGLDCPSLMGSSSTYLKGAFGGLNGRALIPGDRLETRSSTKALSLLSGRTIEKENLPSYSDEITLNVIPGPQDDAFSAEQKNIFLNSQYTISPNSDRMGYRLEGTPIKHIKGADILSDGMMAGSVQIPANGLPIIMMSECGTSGGYTKIATVISSDLPLIAQCSPGAARISFKEIEIGEARQKYRILAETLNSRIIEPDDDPLAWVSV